MTFLEQLGVAYPIIQAPMAGTSTPQMAAAVSNAGGLGSIGVAATGAEGARKMIAEIRARTDKAFNVNVFLHVMPEADPARDAAWLEALRPLFGEFGAEPPAALSPIYRSFADDDAMLAVLLAEKPAVVSFHFGLPAADRITALKDAGCTLLATATNPEEAAAIRRAGVDVIVAQGYEAGGHRGMFDPEAEDTRLGTMALTRLLVAQGGLPVVAAGGIMDGQGVRAALDLGAVAAQLGTAFIDCPESSASAAHRAALHSDAAHHTTMTAAISGRPARCLRNRFTQWAARTKGLQSAYPTAYDAGKALNVAAQSRGEGGFGAQWAGQGAPLARSLPAAELLRTLAKEAGLAGFDASGLYHSPT